MDDLNRLRYSAIGSAALLLTVGSGALAQNVSFYGTFDGGVTSTNNGVATSTGVSSGILGSSRLGAKGSTNLADGVTGIFALEIGFESDTGFLKTYSGNPATATASSSGGTSGTGFNRRSFAGVETNYGTLTLGRDYTPIYYANLESDIFKFGLYGNTQTTVPLAGGSEKFARVSNAIFYTSPKLGGLTGRLAYSFGSESAGTVGTTPKDGNTFFGIGAVYKNGFLTLSGSYQELNTPDVAGATPTFTGSISKRPDTSIGARWDTGSYAVAVGTWRMGAPVNASDSWVGASVKIGQGNLITQVQRIRQDNTGGSERSGTVFGLGYVYNVNKAFDVYATYGQVQNNSTGSFSLLTADGAISPSAVGLNVNGFAFGGRYSF